MSGRASIGDYVVTSKLGSGSFAVVYKGYHKITKTPVAIKALSLHKLNSKLLSNLEMEISIMRQIDHPNVVKLYDIKKTEKHMYLVLEYCAGGDLQHYMRRRQQQNGGNNLLPESVARHFLRELAKGMQCLWQHNLIHRDLKPQNLLLVEDSATSALKIADFGFARQLAATSMAETLCGSPLYMAPEILKFQKYDAKADLWSVGTILFEMVAGRPPYGGANHVQLLANIERQPLRFPPTLQLSRPCRQLVVALLQRKPALRLGFADFFADPFVDLQPLPEQVEEAEAARRSSLSTTASIREEDEEDEQGNSGRWGVANSRSVAADTEASSTPRRGSGSDRRSRAFSVSHESGSSSRFASTTPSALLRQSRSGNLEVMETAFASASSGSGALRRSSSSRLARSRRASSSGSGLTGPNTEQCKARVARLRAPVRPVASQEELLYAHALRIGRQGAIREVLGQTRAAHDHYLQALLLLESLLMDANGSSVGALAVEDQKSVNNFLRALEQRLKNVRSLLDDESSESSANPPRPPQQLTYLRSATAAVLWTEKKKVTTST
ncbi:hypothetical protein JG688_00009430 [Phytophthora aleatoria]|uniref:Protein kinase domain-containing protein n=1 Tax=Phytophthora aleatoria TaxID=2496075 RepID=A0A8J5IRF5_9STRA|nr:hypothetical protein JG688_00009430 [Phytophthora aleatoria]